MDESITQKVQILEEAWPDLCEMVGHDLLRAIVMSPDELSVPEGGSDFDLTPVLAILATSLSIISSVLSILKNTKSGGNIQSKNEILIHIQEQNINIGELNVDDIKRIISAALAVQEGGRKK